MFVRSRRDMDALRELRQHIKVRMGEGQGLVQGEGEGQGGQGLRLGLGPGLGLGLGGSLRISRGVPRMHRPHK